MTLMTGFAIAEFDAERRAFNKLELKRIRQQQAQDKVEADLMAKLEARDASLSGTQLHDVI